MLRRFHCEDIPVTVVPVLGFVIMLLILVLFRHHGDGTANVLLTYEGSKIELDTITQPLKHREPANRFIFSLENWMMLRVETPNGGICQHISAGSPKKNYPLVLSKKSFSETTRFVFIVGLEGSGHHLFRPVLDGCGKCKCPDSIPGFSLSEDMNKRGLFGSKVSPRMVKHHVNQLSEYIYDRTAPNTTFFLNTFGGCWGTGEMSYPNYVGSCRKLQFPDVRILAELMETFHLDFRVVLLIRNAVDILLSTSVHRHFNAWGDLVDIYTELIEQVLLPGQLERIDRNFVACLKYDDLPDVPAELGDFLGIPNLEELMKKGFSKSESTKDRQEEEAEYMARDVNKTYLKLENAVRKLEQFCETV